MQTDGYIVIMEHYNFDSIEVYRSQLTEQGYVIEYWGSTENITVMDLEDCGWQQLYKIFDTYIILKNELMEGFLEYSNDSIWIYAKSYQNLEDIDYELECLGDKKTQKKSRLQGYIREVEEEIDYDIIEEDFDIGDKVVVMQGRMVPRYDPEFGIVTGKVVEDGNATYNVCLNDNKEREIPGNMLRRLDESGKLVWARSGNKVIKKYRCTAGRKKGRLVKAISDCGKFPDIKKRFRFKKLLNQKGARLRRKARRTKKMNPASRRVQQLNKGIKNAK